MTNYRLEETLEKNIETSRLVTVKGKKHTLHFNGYKILEMSPDNESVVEHLGFFHELSKKLKRPYQSILDAFEDHYRKLILSTKTKAKNNA